MREHTPAPLDADHSTDGLHPCPMENHTNMSDLEQRLRRLEDEFDTFSRETQSSLTGIAAALARMEAQKPMGMSQIVSAVLSIGGMIAVLTAGVVYVVSATSEPRLTLLEYRMKVLERPKIGWTTEVQK